MKCPECKKRKVLKDRSLCGSCLNKRWRKADPVRAAFNNLRASAKRRGKVFEITLEYFRAFCVKTEYIAGKGRSAESYHVDRIDEARGYVEGNLQVLSNTENLKKWLSYDWQTKTGRVETKRRGGGDDMPF